MSSPAALPRWAARKNAFTSKDYTVYFQQSANHTPGEAMALEADRMAHLNIAAEADFASEISVIREERRQRTEPAHWRACLSSCTQPPSPPIWRASQIIGWMADLERMRADDLRQWRERWYAPNNATLVVVGDVDPGGVSAGRAALWSHPARTLPARAWCPEPSPYGERRLTLKLPAQQSYGRWPGRRRA